MSRHMSHSFGPCLFVEVGSGATTYPSALDPTSLLRWALMLPREPQLWTPASLLR
jgi:hypothetical protein